MMNIDKHSRCQLNICVISILIIRSYGFRTINIAEFFSRQKEIIH